jgi:uncharacterized protein (DUF58 family)
MTPPPALLNALRRSRLAIRHAVPSTGVGERRSPQKGSGLEFADYREYQPGDDVRHLDPHLHARHGNYFTRQYAVDQQVPVTIVLDASASMQSGEPEKFAFGRDLAASVAFAALAGGDSAQIIACRDGDAVLSLRVQGVDRAPVLFRWIDGLQPAGAGFGKMLPAVERKLKPRSLTFLISDFWLDDPERDLRSLGGSGCEFIALHVLSPQESDPAHLAQGQSCLVDTESGEEVELTIDPATLERYGHALAAWRETLRGAFSRIRGRYLPIRSDASVETLLLRDWRSMGLLQ